MRKIIDRHPCFSAKPIGPIYKHVTDTLRHLLPAAFLHTYIVASHSDAAEMAKLCCKHQEMVPDRLVREYATEIFPDVLIDPATDMNALEILRKLKPVVANLLIDYFELQKQGKFYSAYSAA